MTYVYQGSPDDKAAKDAQGYFTTPGLLPPPREGLANWFLAMGPDYPIEYIYPFQNFPTATGGLPSVLVNRTVAEKGVLSPLTMPLSRSLCVRGACSMLANRTVAEKGALSPIASSHFRSLCVCARTGLRVGVLPCARMCVRGCVHVCARVCMRAYIG